MQIPIFHRQIYPTIIGLVLFLAIFNIHGFQTACKKRWNDWRFPNHIDPLKHDFFENSVTNTKIHDAMNAFISPNHEPIGFQNAELSSTRKIAGSPDMVVSPGLFGLPAIGATAGNTHGYLRANLPWLFDDCEAKDIEVEKALLKPSSKAKSRKIYIVLGHYPKVGIEKELFRHDWFIEKLSIVNKKLYAVKHGYEFIYMNTANTVLHKQKRYQHETREGWERFDILRDAMKGNGTRNEHEMNDVEDWYWYIDIQTMIMQPEISIEKLVFSLIEKQLYHRLQLTSSKSNCDYDTSWISFADKRDIPTLMVDPESESGIELILTEDCYGINLSSFFIKRSIWSDLLLDMLWDPVLYRQKHIEWSKLKRKNKPNRFGTITLNAQENADDLGNPSEIEEKNCLEYFLSTQSWLRSRTAFLPTKVFNSISNDSCIVENNNVLDLLDGEVDETLLDALLESDYDDDDDDDDADLTILIEKIAASKSEGGIIQRLSAPIDGMHYDPISKDFLFNYATCKDFTCWDKTKEAMATYKKLHGRQLFAI